MKPWSHPPQETLLQWLASRSDGQTNPSLQSHLDRCEECQSLAGGFAQFLLDMQDVPSVHEELQASCKRLRESLQPFFGKGAPPKREAFDWKRALLEKLGPVQFLEWGERVCSEFFDLKNNFQGPQRALRLAQGHSQSSLGLENIQAEAFLPGKGDWNQLQARLLVEPAFYQQSLQVVLETGLEFQGWTAVLILFLSKSPAEKTAWLFHQGSLDFEGLLEVSKPWPHSAPLVQAMDLQVFLLPPMNP